MKFKGVYDWRDKLPVLKNGQCIIINKMTNTHWIGSANIGGHMYTYDSFNRPDYIGGNINGDNDSYPDQNINESNCGARCIAWLVTVLSKP